MISGRAGEGKTTFATMCRDYLVKKGHEATIISFAQAVKDTAKSMNWDGNKDDKGRRLLTVIGGAGREYDESTWARMAVKKIVDFFIENADETGQDWGFVFIDDWRFFNEGDVIIEHFEPVMKVRMIRPKEFHLLLNTPAYDDISEISLPDYIPSAYYDYGIENDRDLEYLKNTAETFVELVLLGGNK